jgi:glucose/arabinose dehydrogenase
VLVVLQTAVPRDATPAANADPGAGQYALVPAVTTAAHDQMLGLYPIPGAPDEAVIITQNGLLWRVSLTDSFAPVPFGDMLHCFDAIDDDGDTRVNDGCAAFGAAESGAACTDAIDNDGDGFVNDGCPVFDPPDACDDAIDNEGDGYVNDGCPIVGTSEVETNPAPLPPYNCADAIDNDGDTMINDGCPVFRPTEARLVAGSEEGLVGLAFSPNYETDGQVFLYYTVPENSPPNPAHYCCRDRLARFQVTDDTLDRNSEVLLLDQHDRQPWHIAGQLAFGPDGYLYVGLGDEGWVYDPYGNGQNKAVLYGKVLRLDVTDQTTYAIPPGNPFADGPGGNADEIYAYGFRNPWRFSFDSETGDLWLGDVGQYNWEEVNKVISGGNYGWSIMDGFNCRSAGCTPPADYVPPRVVYCHPQWEPSCPGHNAPGDCAIIGGFVYRGGEMPELDGWYVYGDFCTGKIWAVDTTSDTSDPVLLFDSPYLISSFAQLPDGELLVLTYNNSIHRLTADTDIDGVANINDNCPFITNPDQLDTDGDGLGDVCDPDDDNDLVNDADETACGANPLNSALRPERIDGAFAGVDEDGDTQVDEVLPSGSEAFDCDGDGFKGTAEGHVFSYLGETDGDQKTCQDYDDSFPNNMHKPSKRWPADFNGTPFSLNKINISDIAAFTNPVRYIGKNVGTNPSDVRFDLMPGNSGVGAHINIVDLAAVTSGASGHPPMLGGARAFGGPVCPYAP